MGAAAAAEAAQTWALLSLLSPVLNPPSPFRGTIEDRIMYTRFPTDQWWNAKAGTPVRVTDFNVWQGASAVWRGLYQDGAFVPGTGFPVLVIRIIRDDTYFQHPDPGPYGLPAGFDLYYDDPVRDVRLVVLFDRCTHLCCYPGWHVVSDPPPGRDYATYGASPPTYEVYQQDPVYCLCHGAQYDPLLLAADVNPKNDVPYVGARVVYGPATHAMPIVPIRAVSDVLEGGMANPAWYVYC